MKHLKYVRKDENIDIIEEVLKNDGCVVIEDVLNQAELGKLQAELTPHFEETANCHGDFYGYNTKRLSSLVTKSNMCQQMVIKEEILHVMDRFLLKGCEQYQLHLTQAIRIGSKEYKQPLHRDDVMFPFEHPHYEAMINCMWAVDPFTSQNGATLVVPGSHLWPQERQATEDEVIQAVMRPGSVLVWLGSLLHAGGQNRTDRYRTGIVTSYCLGWLRQAENSYLAVPQETAKELPERLQKLLGYFVHSPNLGCVEGQDPIRILKGDHIVNTGFEEFLPDFVKPLLAEHRKQAAQG